MGEFFGSIYCWFEDFFGLELANYIWGESSPYSQTNAYIGVGLWMLCISFAIVIIFYYLINHPKLNHWWGWLIFFGVNAVINFIIGWQRFLVDYNKDFMVKIDPVSEELVQLDIYPSDIACFGVSNMFLAMMAFIIFTLILKWGSSNCSRAPFC